MSLPELLSAPALLVLLGLLWLIVFIFTLLRFGIFSNDFFLMQHSFILCNGQHLAVGLPEPQAVFKVISHFSYYCRIKKKTVRKLFVCCSFTKPMFSFEFYLKSYLCCWVHNRTQELSCSSWSHRVPSSLCVQVYSANGQCEIGSPENVQCICIWGCFNLMIQVRKKQIIGNLLANIIFIKTQKVPRIPIKIKYNPHGSTNLYCLIKEDFSFRVL